MSSIASIIKTIIFSSLIYRFGFIWAIIISILRNIIFRNLFRILFGWKELDAMEYGMIKSPGRATMTGFLIMDSFKPEELRTTIIENGIKKFDMLRKNIIQKFGNYYWSNVELEEAIKSVKILPDMQINSIQELSEYSIEEQNKPIPLEKVQYEFQIFRYANNGMVFYVKFDHSLSDGIGFMGFLMALADNYDVKMFPTLRKTTFFENLLLQVCSPFYMVKYMLDLSRLPYELTLFKGSGGPKGKKMIKVGKNYNFTQITKISKSLGISFNEFVTALLSKVSNSYINKIAQSKEIVKSIVIISPFSTRQPPKTLNEAVLNNQIMSLPYSIPLITDVKKEYAKVKTVLDKYLRNPFLAYGAHLLLNLLSGLIPDSYTNAANMNYAKPIDLIVSNVPGPKSQLIYSGTKVTSLMPTPNQLFFNNFLAIITYNDEFCFTFSTDSNKNVNANDFVELLEKELDSFL